MLCFTNVQKITHFKKTHTKSFDQSIKVANTYLGVYNQHRFGSTRSEVIQNSMFSTSQYSIHFPPTIQMPATVSFRRRHSRQRVTTSLPIISTTALYRGDQQPSNDEDDNDDNDNQDEIEAFVPLGVKNQPVTVQPIYFTNERDNTQKHITTTTKTTKT